MSLTWNFVLTIGWKLSLLNYYLRSIIFCGPKGFNSSHTATFYSIKERLQQALLESKPFRILRRSSLKNGLWRSCSGSYFNGLPLHPINGNPIRTSSSIESSTFISLGNLEMFVLCYNNSLISVYLSWSTSISGISVTQIFFRATSATC